MPVIYTWTHKRNNLEEETLPLFIKDPDLGNLLAIDESCCCEGCRPCQYLPGESETCEGEGCVSSDNPSINGWYETYAEAKQAGIDATYAWCGDSPCCSVADDKPCFVVKCDDNSPNKCERWGWELCCSCCPYQVCADNEPLPGAAGAGCVADDCTGGYGCIDDQEGDGYCTASDAVNNVPFGAVECDGSNCDSGFGCYYITCDDDLCEKKFNWVTCVCRSP